MSDAADQNQFGETAGDLVARALVFAAVAHRNQMRKGEAVPYIVHPVEVCRVLREHGFDESLQTLHAAALLHDVVEDAGVSYSEIDKLFPAEVSEWVEWCSEVKADENGEKLPWEIRKREHLARLEKSPWQSAAIVLADKIHNLCDIVAKERSWDYWQIFSAPPEQLHWYYLATIDACRRPGKTDSLCETVAKLVAELETCVSRSLNR